MARDDVRFHQGDTHSVLVNQLKKAEEDVLGVPADYVLVMSVEDLVDELFARWIVNPLVVHFDQRSSSGTKGIDFYVAGWEDNRIRVAGSCIRFVYHVVALERIEDPDARARHPDAVVLPTRHIEVDALRA